jgi:hypothetical protein
MCRGIDPLLPQAITAQHSMEGNSTCVRLSDLKCNMSMIHMKQNSCKGLGRKHQCMVQVLLLEEMPFHFTSLGHYTVQHVLCTLHLYLSKTQCEVEKDKQYKDKRMHKILGFYFGDVEDSSTYITTSLFPSVF